MALADSNVGELLFEQMNLNRNRKAWLQKEFPIKGLYRTKRYIQHVSVAEKCLQWCSGTRWDHSLFDYDILDVKSLEEFAETF